MSLKVSKGTPTQKPCGYNIVRFGSGYAITKNGFRITEPDMLNIILEKLNKMIRRELGV